MKRTPEDYLLDIFRSARDKHEAHRRSAALLGELTYDRAFITAALRRHIEKPGALNTRNYPVVGVDVALNEHFGVVINCWIPLPDRSATTSTKAIHHHGDMLLTTATVQGPGYEHWLFTRPQLRDEASLLYDIDVVERAPHPAHHVAFVDADTPHMPWYPPDTTLTLCLWSSRHPVTWRDRLKRVPILKRNERRLRDLVKRVGLGRVAQRAMQLKVVELFDYYPTDDGFVGMVERQEYERGPNEDHLYSLFHVLQRTGNEALAVVVDERLRVEPELASRALVVQLNADLKAGRAIEGRLSSCHLAVPHAMFSQTDVNRALPVKRRAGTRS